jgi:hypothetical protein
VVTSRRRPWAHRSVAAALGALVFAAMGCGNLLGFEDPVLVHCVLASDCGGSNALVCRSGICTPECRTDKDCQDSPERPVCVGGSCAKGQESTPTVGDSSVETEAAAPVAEGGSCDASCPAYSACRDDACLSVTRVGWSSPTGNMEVAEHRYIQAFQIQVDLCGFATGVGLDVAISNHERFRLALYSDNGGNPDALIAETGVTTFIQGVNEEPLGSLESIGCSEEGGNYYWVAGIWSEDSVEVVCESTPVARGISVPEPDDGASIFSNGFPASFPAGGQQSTSSQPHVYIIMAHS